MKKLFAALTLLASFTASAASVEIEFKRLGLENLEFFAKAGASEKVRVLDFLTHIEEDPEKHIVLVYTAHTSAGSRQYNGNITAKIFNMPADLSSAPDCTISLDIRSNWDSHDQVRADLSDPGKIFQGQCDYGF